MVAPVLPSESEHTKAQALLALEVAELVGAQWGRVGSDFDAGWARARPAVEAVTRAGMIGSAANASRLVPAQLEQSGHDVTPDVGLVPATFGAQTMLGVDVGRALDSTVIRTKQAVSAGATVEGALDVGGSWLDRLTRSVMADANRAAQQALITATPRMGWVRVVPAPCCKRCAVLAGRWYRHSAGFARHPRCDCYHRPAPQDMRGTADLPTPKSLLAGGFIKDLSDAERQAVTDGADLVSVVNAGRGRRGMTTTEGTTRGGAFGRANPGRQRLTPSAIYRLGSDRDEHVRLLIANGYMR